MNELLVFITRFAITYDCGAYGASTYNNDGPCSTNGALAGTGVDVLLLLAVGLALVVSSIALLFILHKKSSQAKK
jgi:hypothetical protein